MGNILEHLRQNLGSGASNSALVADLLFLISDERTDRCAWRKRETILAVIDFQLPSKKEVILADETRLYSHKLQKSGIRRAESRAFYKLSRRNQ